MEARYDVLIVGGGPAGLSAALTLGRCLRTVLVCDAGRQRNLSSHAIHGLPGHEGRSPASFLAVVRREIEAYPSVRLHGASITGLDRTTDGIDFRCSDGTTGRARKVILATGLVDQLPAWPRIEEFYGRSIHHCLYCDGAEHAHQPLIAYGAGDKGAGLALMMRHWSPNVTLCTDGASPSEAMRNRLAQNGIAVIDKRITDLNGSNGKLTSVRLHDGTELIGSGLFFTTGCEQGSPLALSLGCRRDDDGKIIIDPLTEETTVPGIYVAGDVSRDVLLVAVAIGEGVKAAVAVNRALLTADDLL